MSLGMGLDIDLRALNKAFDALPEKVQKKVTRSAVGFAMTPVVKEARHLVQKDTGFTAESIKKKTKAYEGGGIATSLVGVDARARIEINGKPHQPKYIDHLLSEGFIHAKSGRYVPGSRFMSESLKRKLPLIKRRLLAKLDDRIKKETAKLKATS